ncbi:MAG: hypothetical protein U9O86_08270 [Campylobacterota bacterium]|nr:hypothetical protein [Campylobacterota bacterium]
MIDTSSYMQVDLKDGNDYAKVYVSNITENDALFSALEESMKEVGSYLENVTYS